MSANPGDTDKIPAHERGLGINERPIGRWNHAYQPSFLELVGADALVGTLATQWKHICSHPVNLAHEITRCLAERRSERKPPHSYVGA